MKTHLLCYIRRDRLASWKLDSLKRGTRKQPILAYGSGDPTFAEFAKLGNVLWVIGGSPDAPPSLEARIEIAGTLKEDKEWNCEVKGSQKGSRFFGLNDASAAVMQLVFKSDSSLWSLRDKYLSSEWDTSYGRELQGPRRVAPSGERINRHRSSGAEPLEELARCLKARSIFISWKHADNDRNRRNFIKVLTNELARRGFAVWWDQTALTNAGVVNEYCKDMRDTMMNRLLHQGMLQTKVVLALWTENYGVASTPETPNWTRKEWETSGVKRIALVSGKFVTRRPLTDPDQIIAIPKNLNPGEAARVAKQFNHIYIR